MYLAAGDQYMVPGPFHFVADRGDWRKVPFDDHRAAAVHSTWPPRQPSWIWFPSII
jgi:hypothetical protein